MELSEFIGTLVFILHLQFYPAILQKRLLKIFVVMLEINIELQQFLSKDVQVTF